MITIKKTDKYASYGFTVEGHAEYAEHGQDIVCAGVSSLVQFVYKSARYVGADNGSSIKPGLAIIKLRGGTASEALVQPFYYLVKELESQYPKNIKVENFYD